MDTVVSAQRVRRPIIMSCLIGGSVGLCASFIYLTSVLLLVLDANRRYEIVTYDSFVSACLLSAIPSLLGAVSAGLISTTILTYARTSLRAAQQVGVVIPALVMSVLASILVLFGGLFALLFWLLFLSIPAAIYLVLGRLGASWFFHWMQFVNCPESTPLFLDLKGTHVLIRRSMLLLIASLCYQCIRALYGV